MEKTYFIIALSDSNPDVMFVKSALRFEFNSLTFLRSLALVYTDYDCAVRDAYLFESSVIPPFGLSFHVVENTNLW